MLSSAEAVNSFGPVHSKCLLNDLIIIIKIFEIWNYNICLLLCDMFKSLYSINME